MIGDSNSEEGAYHQNSVLPLLHGLIILGYGAFASMPALIYGFILGDDALSHLVMSRNFVEQFLAGDLYPRWLFEVNAGLGSPVFHFYGPIPYYVTALLHPLSGNDPEGWRQLGMTSALAIIASGITGYAWLKCFCSANASLIGAILYMTAPYHLTIDLYQRFALAELWGFVWMPLILLQAERLICQRDKSIVGLAIAYALLISTHLSTTLLFSPVLLMYSFFRSNGSLRNPILIRIAGAMLLGIGLSSTYFLPAMATQANIRLTDITTGHFYFGHHFLFASTYPTAIIQNISETVARVTLITAATSLLICLLGYRKLNPAARKFCLFWVTIMTGAILMMLPYSQLLWEIVQPIQTIQFPWRLNTVVTLSATILITNVISASLATTAKHRTILLLAICTPLMLSSIPSIFVHTALARGVGVLSLDRLIEIAGNNNPNLILRLEASKINRYDSFLPKAITPELFVMTLGALETMKQLGAQHLHTSEHNNESARITSWQPGRILLETSYVTAGKLTIHQFYYPGWTARIAGQASELPLIASQPYGLLQIDVPPGKHVIQITLETTSIEHWGQMVSAISVLIALFLTILNLLTAKQKRIIQMSSTSINHD